MPEIKEKLTNEDVLTFLRHNKNKKYAMKGLYNDLKKHFFNKKFSYRDVTLICHYLLGQESIIMQEISNVRIVWCEDEE